MWKNLLILGVVFAQSYSIAFASLGDDSSSIEMDREHFHSKLSLHRKFAAHQVKEITTGGMRIREYFNNDGKIFAVAWDGIAHPDLSKLLGNYFEEFKEINLSSPKMRGQRSFNRMESDHMIIERSGHMRALKGRAYIPDLLPAGVSVDELR